MREARARRDWIAGELASMRVPDIKLLGPAEVRTLASVAEKWRTSRVDVADGTATTHSVNIGRIVRVLGDRDVEALAPADVAELIARLHEDGLRRESIRKTRSTLAMILDFAGRKGDNNPATRK